ncbi:hypothetical protein CPB85DRAFT_242891 [Mucidula mucida]|nr:hypothetical protein CPB85DRAFT_242891 [Mucidula mucida]
MTIAPPIRLALVRRGRAEPDAGQGARALVLAVHYHAVCPRNGGLGERNQSKVRFYSQVRQLYLQSFVKGRDACQYGDISTQRISVALPYSWRTSPDNYQGRGHRREVGSPKIHSRRIFHGGIPLRNGDVPVTCREHWK